MEGLERFVEAQARVWPAPLEELRRGRKDSHWMWFVLPQIAGLGRSETARFYALRDLAEAEAYAAHPVLGPRLRATVAATLPHAAGGPRALFGAPDDMKYRSCLTLFEAATGEALFARALDAFYEGGRCAATLARI